MHPCGSVIRGAAQVIRPGTPMYAHDVGVAQARFIVERRLRSMLMASPKLVQPSAGVPPVYVMLAKVMPEAQKLSERSLRPWKLPRYTRPASAPYCTICPKGSMVYENCAPEPEDRGVLTFSWAFSHPGTAAARNGGQVGCVGRERERNLGQYCVGAKMS